MSRCNTYCLNVILCLPLFSILSTKMNLARVTDGVLKRVFLQLNIASSFKSQPIRMDGA